MRSITIAFLVMAVVAVSSCKKKQIVAADDNTVQGNAAIVLTNNTDDSVYLFMNGHDIATGTAPHIIEHKFAPGETIKIPRADLKDAFNYRYEWYTSGYTFSNWWATGADGKAIEQKFDYYADTTDYDLQLQSMQRDDLLRCMDGDGIAAYWEPVDAFSLSGVSVWDTLSDKEKNHTFTIYRHHTIRHSFIDTAGKQAATNLSFAFDLTQPRTWLRVDEGADSYILSNKPQISGVLSETAMDRIYYFKTAKLPGGATVFVGPYYLLSRVRVER